VFREAGTQVSPVTMSESSLWPHLFAAIKDPEGGRGVFVFAFAFWGFTLGFCAFGLFALGGLLPMNIGKKLVLWAFWYGKLLKGKRIVEGKMLKRG
jgi:hypothetical protein